MWPWPKRSDKDFAAEIQIHIAQETKRLVEDEGLDVDEATARSRRSFGNVAQAQERFYERRRIAWVEHVRRDAAHGLRGLRRNPGFGAAAVVMLAVGIGATTAMFSVLKSVLLSPLPYANADRLVRVVHNIGGIEQPYFNDGIIATYTEHSQAFESFGVWVPSGQGVTVTGNGDPEEVRALAVSRGLLTTLGVQPEIGRWFASQDDSPGSTDTVMIGNGYWRQKYGSDPSVLGRTIMINARPWQIIGVMPAHSLFIGEFDVVMPLRINAAHPSSFFRLNGVARMKPDITLAQANADIARMLEIYFDNFQQNTSRAVSWLPSLVPLKQHVIGDVGSTLWVLMGTTAVLLLMACTNVANLLLVRTESRRQEFAICAALGANWTRLAGALMVESLLLATIGGAIGVAMAWAGIQLLVAMEPGNLPRLFEISLDPATIAFAVCMTLGAGLLLSAIPIAKSFAFRFTPVPGTRSTDSHARAPTIAGRARRTAARTRLGLAGELWADDSEFSGTPPYRTWLCAVPHFADVRHDHSEYCRVGFGPADTHAPGNSRQGRSHSRRQIRSVHDAVANGPAQSMECRAVSRRPTPRWPEGASEPSGEAHLARSVSDFRDAARRRPRLHLD